MSPRPPCGHCATGPRRPSATLLTPIPRRCACIGRCRRISIGSADRVSPTRCARAFDAALRDFLSKNPHGPVIALGEGLQTTYWRLGAPDVIWLSVDLPEIVEAQERLLPPAPAITRLPMSALDRRWLAAAPAGPAMITAEGLFMYLPQDQVYALIADLAGRFPGGALIYDAIPRLLSLLSLTGQLRLSNRYVMPRMPTSQSSRQRARLSRTIPGIASVREVPVPAGRGLWASPLLKSASRTPLLRDLLPSITLLEFADGN